MKLLLSGVPISLTSFNYQNVEDYFTFCGLSSPVDSPYCSMAAKSVADNSGQTTGERQLARVESGGVNLADGRWRRKSMGSCVLSGTWVTHYSEHIGNTFGHLRGVSPAKALEASATAGGLTVRA
jgi:hypothetical protein